MDHIYIYIYLFFFFRESFNLWCLFLMIVYYHQTKTSISFWWGLNLRSLIQLSETLPIELTGTHMDNIFLNLVTTHEYIIFNRV